MIQNFHISCAVISGNSGGPALTPDREVIGIASNGGKTLLAALSTEDNRVICLSELLGAISEKEA